MSRVRLRRIHVGHGVHKGLWVGIVSYWLTNIHTLTNKCTHITFGLIPMTIIKLQMLRNINLLKAHTLQHMHECQYTQNLKVSVYNICTWKFVNCEHFRVSLQVCNLKGHFSFENDSLTSCYIIDKLHLHQRRCFFIIQISNIHITLYNLWIALYFLTFKHEDTQTLLPF